MCAPVHLRGLARSIGALLAIAAFATAVPGPPAAAQDEGSPSAALATMRYDIVGPELRVDPPTLTVPKNVPTQLHAVLVPAGSETTVVGRPGPVRIHGTRRLST